MSSIFSRKDSESAIRAVVQQFNALHQATIATSFDGYHRDISGIPSGDYTAPTSSTLAVDAITTSDLDGYIEQALSVQGVIHSHFADDCAHLIADDVNIDIDGYAIDYTSAGTKQSSLNELLNAAKVVFNAHLTESGVHLKNDTANSVATADASSLDTSGALSAQMKTSVNAHIVSGPSVGRVRLIEE